jgi:hypothetical protein
LLLAQAPAQFNLAATVDRAKIDEAALPILELAANRGQFVGQGFKLAQFDAPLGAQLFQGLAGDGSIGRLALRLKRSDDFVLLNDVGNDALNQWKRSIRMLDREEASSSAEIAGLRLAFGRSVDLHL